jgi:hypothetical protein
MRINGPSSISIETRRNLKNKPLELLIALACVLLSVLVIFGGCKSSRPVQVVSVSTGPELDIPGEQFITITLKNISSKPIVYVLATLTLSTDNSLEFMFKADSLNPLGPDTVISQTRTLTGDAVKTDKDYSLDVRGIFEGNDTFQFVQQTAISVVPPG